MIVSRPPQRLARPIVMAVCTLVALIVLAGGGREAEAATGPLIAPATASHLAEAQFWLFDRRRNTRRQPRQKRRGTVVNRPRRATRARRAPARKRQQTQRQAGPRATPFGEVAATENTTRVVLFGDSMAKDLADGLAATLTEEKGYQVQRMFKGSSGIVRKDFYDWEAEITRVTAGERIDLAIFMIGINDRQAIREDGKNYQPKTPRWTEIYQARVDKMISLLQEKGAAIYWIGLPIMRSNRFSTDMASLNTIFRERAELRGARYIDTWDAFADANGKYTSDGPDLTGTKRKMRKSNGIHLTVRGNEKLAHFIEQALQRDTTVAGLGPNGRRIIQQGSRGGLAVVSGASAAADANALAGAEGSNDPVQGVGGPAVALSTLGSGAKSDGEEVVSPLFKVLMRGEALEPKKGRADDFAWPREE